MKLSSYTPAQVAELAMTEPPSRRLAPIVATSPESVLNEPSMIELATMPPLVVMVTPSNVDVAPEKCFGRCTGWTVRWSRP